MTKQSVAALLTIMIAVMSTCRVPMGTERTPQVSNVDMVGKRLSFSAASRKWPRLAQKQNQLVLPLVNVFTNRQSVAALLTIMIAVMSTCRAPMGTERKPQVSNVDMVGKGLSFSAASRKWPRPAQKQNQLVPGRTQLVPPFSSSAPLALLLSSCCVRSHALISYPEEEAATGKRAVGRSEATSSSQH